jgi:nucleoside-diphosphate-sugar epimerase
MITVLGASGFIGSHLVKRLDELGMEYLAPDRHEKLSTRNLGEIIYCIGLTADFRERPLDTVEAHVCQLLRVVSDLKFDSLLYLSSTRVYGNSADVANEEQPLQVNPVDKEHLYEISKIMGEALLLAINQKVRVARLSNVYGADFDSDNFLSSIIKEAISTGKVVVKTSPASAKDYISVDDTIGALIDIATRGKHRVYNVAQGRNTSNEALAQKIAELTGCGFTFGANAPGVSFPMISIERIQSEFTFRPTNILDDLDGIVDLYRSNRKRFDDNDRS